MLKERSGPNFVTATTAVQLKLKEVIIRDVLEQKPRETTFRLLKKIIEEFASQIGDENLRQKFARSLARGAVDIYNRFVHKLENIATSFGIPLSAIILSVSKKTTSDNNNLPTTEEDANRYGEYLYEDRIEIPHYHKKVKEEIQKLVEQIADEDLKDNNGATLRNLAEINVRHDYQQASIAQMRTNGIKLVWASTHVDCSARCFPWQGKLYSLDGTYGKTQTGVSYIPLEVAVNVPYTTKSGKTYMNGLLGFNCRHRLIPYRNEQVPPKGYTKAQTKNAYRIDQAQRAMERAIRKVKQRAHLLKNMSAVKQGEVGKLFEKARNMTKAYREFCEKNDTVAMIYRTQVTLEEQSFNNRRMHTSFENVYDSTGKLLVPAGTHFDKVRLIAGKESKNVFRDEHLYLKQFKAKPFTLWKMSGIINKNGKGKDSVHWIQDYKVKKYQEKDGRPTRGKT